MLNAAGVDRKYGKAVPAPFDQIVLLKPFGSVCSSTVVEAPVITMLELLPDPMPPVVGERLEWVVVSQYELDTVVLLPELMPIRPPIIEPPVTVPAE